jgi:hypothetical protein
LDPGLELTVEDLQLVPDRRLGLAGDLAPYPALAVGGVAQGDRGCPAAVSRIEVNRVLAVPMSTVTLLGSGSISGNGYQERSRLQFGVGVPGELVAIT